MIWGIGRGGWVRCYSWVFTGNDVVTYATLFLLGSVPRKLPLLEGTGLSTLPSAEKAPYFAINLSAMKLQSKAENTAKMSKQARESRGKGGLTNHSAPFLCLFSCNL